MSARRAFYALFERGVPVELQMYPMARRAFDFRSDQTARGARSRPGTRASARATGSIAG